MATDYKNLIDGELVDNGEWMDVLNPANEEVIGRVPASTLALSMTGSTSPRITRKGSPSRAGPNGTATRPSASSSRASTSELRSSERPK